MNRKLLLLFLFMLFACEAEEIIGPYDCMTCIRTIREDGVVVEEIEMFVCGEELIKQKNINHTYINEFYGTIITVSTHCYREPCKSK